MIVEGFWQNKNVFVTGAGGFLGAWLTAELNQLGANVVGLVRDMPGSHKPSLIPDSATDFVVFGALENHPLLLRALNEYEIDTVFHLGAQPIVGIANRNPMSTFEANIQGTWNMLEACRMVSTVKRVVIASSDKAYGEQPKLPYDEDMPLQGMHPYDVSKSCADLIAQAYHNTYSTPVCITRCGNFFGGGDLNYNRIVPGTIRSAIQGEAPIIRSDGSFIRDYVYVRDVAQFYILLAQAMDDTKLHGHAFNYSTESQLTVVEITTKILDLMGEKTLQPMILNEASGEIPHQYLSAEKARKILNWSPNFTIDEALLETIEWYRNYLST